MTKQIRIENADSGTSFPVRVTTQDKVYDANGVWSGEWRDTSSQQIDQPTAMFQNYLTSSRRFIVEELPAPTPTEKAAG